MASGDQNVHTRVTLPPPEWAPAPVAPESPPSVIEPVQRREGRKAEEATLRAMVSAARASGDPEAERRAAIELARHLAKRERDLDEAVELGLGALGRGEDVELRKEVASWLEMLGEPGTAAMVLRKTSESGAAAAATMVRVGVLLARAGDARGASAAFEDAAKLDESDATALELRGTISSWAPDVVDAKTAARCFAEAAARRKEAGGLNGELEDALRAFEIDAGGDAALRALETALRDRGRSAAADFAARAHAMALEEGPPRRRGLVRIASERLGSAAYVEALGASLDAGLDRIFSGEDAATFDGVLLRLGLIETLAARLEVRAESQTEDRRTVREQLARLFSGPLGSPMRAALQHVRMIAEDPSREESLLALRELAETGDRAPLVEALVRGAAAKGGDAEARAHCARSLALFAEETLRHPMLAQWAYKQLRDLAASDARAQGLIAGLGDIEAAVRRLDVAEPENERKQWRSALGAGLERDSHNFGLGRWLLRQELTPPDEVEARAALAAAARQRGDAGEACSLTAPLAERRASEGYETSGARAASLAWVNAALAGDARVRARALESLASFSAPAVRAVLLACASEGLRALARAPEGASDEVALLADARRLAEAACEAEPSSPRAIVALALASARERERPAASVLERAATAVFATGEICEALGDTLEALGERDYAVAWTQRLVALRPGDARVIARLVERVAELGDASRLMDAVLWLLPQPLPASTLAPLVARAIDTLTALDPSRAAPAARRALDALGPRNEQLTATLARAAERASDDALTAALLARRIGTVAAPEERVLLLLELAELEMRSDPDGALRTLAQAVTLGADATRVAAAADGAQGATSGDAELQRAQIRAAALEAEAGSPASRRGVTTRSSRRVLDAAAESACRALRALGAMQWDMAGDARGALETWLRAARIAPSGGYAALGVDLARFAGAQPALEKLQSLVAGEKDPMRAGAIAAEAARAALAINAPIRALELAEAALTKNPLVAEAIELAERGALAAGRIRDLSRVYDALGARARGRFGRRAAHYRGARFFDQRGESDLALKHAALAFAAVPSEGGTFFQLARIAERTGDASYAVRTIEEVADASPKKGIRAGWLLRAAQVAGGGDEGARMRVDVLLKAAFLQPMPSTLALLGDAARDLLARAPEERPMLQVRFAKASHALARKLEGPDGARVALGFMTLALELFDDVDDALSSLDRALGSDADLEEYVLLLAARAFARARQRRARRRRARRRAPRQTLQQRGRPRAPLARRDRAGVARLRGRGAHANGRRRARGRRRRARARRRPRVAHDDRPGQGTLREEGERQAAHRGAPRPVRSRASRRTIRERRRVARARPRAHRPERPTRDRRADPRDLRARRAGRGDRASRARARQGRAGRRGRARRRVARGRAASRASWRRRRGGGVVAHGRAPRSGPARAMEPARTRRGPRRKRVGARAGAQRDRVARPRRRPSGRASKARAHVRRGGRFRVGRRDVAPRPRAPAGRRRSGLRD